MSIASVTADRPFGRGLISTGILIIGLFLGGFSAWAALAPIQSAVVAAGVVSVDSSRKIVQHLEGGIVAEIAVREGSRVEAGDLLLRLKDTAQLARRNQLRAQREQALGAVARLRAERDGGDLVVPAALAARATEPDTARLLAGQRSILDSRRRLRAEQRAVYAKRIAGLEEEIAGLRVQIAAAGRQRRYIDEEVRLLKKMLAKKLVNKPRLLALQRERAKIDGTLGEHRASIARADQGIAEAKLGIAQLKAEALKGIDEELRTQQARVYELTQQLAAAEDVLARTRVVSPIDGTVVGLRVHTLGGVVAAGEPLLDVVPGDEELIVRANVDPLDIEMVSAGQAAHVEISAINRRQRMPIEGRVETVSADALTDPTTGATYYLARVRLQPESLRAQGISLQPGMSAEVMIRTGERSALEYLAAPISRSLGRAMREQ